MVIIEPIAQLLELSYDVDFTGNPSELALISKFVISTTLSSLYCSTTSNWYEIATPETESKEVVPSERIEDISKVVSWDTSDNCASRINVWY